jgi:hypothetical protein
MKGLNDSIPSMERLVYDPQYKVPNTCANAAATKLSNVLRQAGCPESVL